MDKTRKDKSFEHIGQIIPQVLKTCRRHKDAGLSEVWRFWNEAVGEIVAENAQPAAFKGDLLLVHVSSSTWIHHLRFIKQDIIKKINAALGNDLIQEIKFKIGPL